MQTSAVDGVANNNNDIQPWEAYRLNFYYMDARFAVRNYNIATPAACEKV